ncbi:MAG: type II toxin-antitoxin system RelE/ParE family toxin [Ginsengibacter sp.]
MVSNPVYTSILSTRAQKEITQSWEWYEERQQNLGDRFVKEIINKIRLIEEYPEKYPTRYKSYKEAHVPVFPFLIIYRLNRRKKSIRIVSVFHTSLNPKKKYK